MLDSEAIKSALARFVSQSSTPEDEKLLRQLFARADLNIGGDADGAVINIGNGNSVFHLSNVAPAHLKELTGGLFPPALFQIGPPSNDFTGREDELNELIEHVSKGGVTISGVRGMGGIGKTELAKVLAGRIKKDYPDGQFYLDLKGTTEPRTACQAMEHVIRGYQPMAKMPEGRAELHNIYLSVLNGKRVLLLMDNALDAAQVGPLVPPEGCCLLITSRQYFTIKGWHAIDLTTLLPDKARQLLCKMAPRLSEKEADSLTDLCGRLPLALCLAGGALAARADLAPAEYMARLKDGRNRLKTLDKYKDYTDEEIGIEASLELTYVLLGAQLQQAWRLLAVFPESFDVMAAASVWACKSDQAKEQLGDLLARSAIEWDKATQRYSLHDLVRVYADAKASAGEREEAGSRHVAHFILTLAFANRLYLMGKANTMVGLAIFDLERVNIQTGQLWAAKRTATNNQAALFCCKYPAVGIHCLTLRQHPRKERIPWLQAALKAARQLNDRTDEEAHLSSLGLAHAHLGEHRKAIEYYEQSLVIASDNQPMKSVTLGNLGNVYAEMGETDKAIEYYEKQLNLVRTIDNRAESCALSNLGLVYFELGEIRKAIDYFEQSLNISHKNGYQFEEGGALLNLGSAYGKLGENHKAIDYFERGLSLSLITGDRRGMVSGLWNMANLELELGHRSRAIELAEQALAIAEEIEAPQMAMIRQFLEILRKA